MSKVTVGEVATVAINLFAEDCINAAKENWGDTYTVMLETLFESVKNGYEYKCVRCRHFRKPEGAYPDTMKECLWKPSEENGIFKPCEEE